MSRFQPIHDIAALCARRGLNYAVLCPGSRCAPLTLAFARHPDIQTRTIPDERSAAFIALGIAQQAQTPAVLVCTSGSAAYNFAPAVAEAYFSETPLLVLTADRPAEWIAQHDGQTIFQPGIFGKHVKASFDLPADYDHPDSVWAINRIINDAINLATQEPCGPVHVNAPFREPLYPRAGEETPFSPSIRVVDDQAIVRQLSFEQRSGLSESFNSFNNILVVAGQTSYDPALLLAVDAFSQRHRVPVLAEVISNLHPVRDAVRYADLILQTAPPAIRESLQPDLLITFGKSVISKNVKLFLRRFRPRAHWHIQSDGPVADPFQSVTEVIRTTPASFFDFLSTLDPAHTFERQKQHNFYRLWEVEDRRMSRALESFFPQADLNELELVREILRTVPEPSVLHLANSMSVRYANMAALPPGRQSISVHANRGTSGIDGCTSTAVGQSFHTASPVFLITGDMAFFYDRNAFWHNYPMPNLRIVVLNNHGGTIFGLIDGPGNLPEAKEYFITEQRLDARKLCEEFGFDHLRLDHRRKEKNLLRDFFEMDGRTKVLELETDPAYNKKVLEDLKKTIIKSYEQ